MPETALATYLKNHLSGSLAELELAQRAATSFAGTPEGIFLDEYVLQIESDREAMRELLKTTGNSDDSLKKIGRWAMERVVISRLADFTGHAIEFSRLVEIEGALIGCQGRQMMWSVLQKSMPGAISVDFGNLQRKAQDHSARLELILLSLAVRAFTG